MECPGAGKSFFARQFAELYSLPRVSEDRIRYELFQDPQYTTEEADIINRMMYYMIEEAMQTEQAIVCEGAYLTHTERKAIYDLARQNGYRTLTVWLQTDVETAYQRAVKRDRRNPDSKYAFELTQHTFTQLKDRLQRPTDKEVAVVISGKHAFKSQNLTVLKKIASVYSSELLKSQSASSARPRTGLRSTQRFVQ